jgi:flagellar basal body rod protein FlgB
MSLFNDKISLLLNHRMTWLGARSNLMAENIALADVKGATRREMLPFRQVLKRHNAIPSPDNAPVKLIKIDKNDTIGTKTEISREMETLEMSRAVLEHDAIVSTVKGFHQLIKSILSMSQGAG